MEIITGYMGKIRKERLSDKTVEGESRGGQEARREKREVLERAEEEEEREMRCLLYYC